MKKGFTLVEVMIVVLIIGVLLGIAAPSFMKAREKTLRTQCHENLRVIDAAKHQWSLDEGQDAGATPTASDLAPDYMKEMPTCPMGGTYTIGSNQQAASCSIHGTAP